MKIGNPKKNKKEVVNSRGEFRGAAARGHAVGEKNDANDACVATRSRRQPENVGPTVHLFSCALPRS